MTKYDAMRNYAAMLARLRDKKNRRMYSVMGAVCASIHGHGWRTTNQTAYLELGESLAKDVRAILRRERLGRIRKGWVPAVGKARATDEYSQGPYQRLGMANLRTLTRAEQERIGERIVDAAARELWPA